MPTKPRLAGLALLAASALALTGCATGAAETSSGSLAKLDPDKKISIVFESYNLATAGAWTNTIEGLIADFETEHPNITVIGQGVASDQTTSSVQTQLLAGNPPDVAQLTFDALDYAVTELGAQPLEDLVGSKAIDDHLGGEHPFQERAAVLADWEGKTIGLPYVFSTPVLFYNASAFEAAGVPADVDLSTWDAVKTVATKITAATGKPAINLACAVKGGNWCMQGVFRSNEARVLSEDRSTIEFGEPEAIEAVEMLRDLYDAGVLTNLDQASQTEAFSRGDAVMQLQSSAAQSNYIGAAKAGGWELRAAAMPGFTGKQVVPTNSGSALFMFSTDPQKQAAAWEFMKFLTSEHAYETITTGIGYLPLRTSLTEPGEPLEWYATNPLATANLAQLADLEPWTSYPGNSYTQIDDILATAIEESVFYGKDPAKTMADAQKRAQTLIED